jgi:hypothetical protein
MSGEDFANFRALYSVDPWGSERDNIHTAMILAQSANQQRTKRTDPVVSPMQFMLGRTNPTDKSSSAKISALRSSIHKSKNVQ